jgi:hypothetical protein
MDMLFRIVRGILCGVWFLLIFWINGGTYLKPFEHAMLAIVILFGTIMPMNYPKKD